MTIGLVLILGQGLAGTTLAHTLLKRQCEVVVADNGHLTSSSMVAAGLWNPIVFRRINKGWMADEFTVALESFYPEMETLLNARFYHPLDVLRVHSSETEMNLWEEKKNHGLYAKYLGKRGNNGLFPFKKEPEYGTAFVHHTGFLDVKEYLESSGRFFKKKGIALSGHLELPMDAQELAGWNLRGMKPEIIIDCRGSSSAEQPLFSWLPFGLTKGEVLTIRTTGFSVASILNAGIFLLPQGRDIFRVGATFNWDERNNIPTEKARKELTERLEKVLSLDFDIVEQRAGIRPTVQDRRPLIGKHPLNDKLYIFNGLGTKGVLLAPWLASHFADYLLAGATLLPEVDIRRFYHMFGSKNPSANYPVS